MHANVYAHVEPIDVQIEDSYINLEKVVKDISFGGIRS